MAIPRKFLIFDTSCSSVTAQPLVLALRVLAITLCALFCTYIIPGIVAGSGDVFYARGVIKRLPPSAARSLSDFEAHKQRRQAELDKINGILTKEPSTSITPETEKPLVQLRSDLSKEIAEAVPPITPIGFFNAQTFMFPALYTSLGWLVFLARPSGSYGKRKSAGVLLTTMVIYIFYDWPLWIRNFVLSNEDRRIYAYTNTDIYLPSFIAQELVIFGFCFLLGAMWQQWSTFFIHRKEELEDSRSSTEIALDPKTWERISVTFAQWQACSIILAFGFLFATNFYWTIEVKSHDARYLLSAISIHLLWGISWIILSAPLIATWHNWERVRVAALSSLMVDSGRSVDQINALSTFLLGIRPLSPAAISLSTLGAAISFLLPFLRAIVS